MIAAALEPAARALDVNAVLERAARLYLESLAPFDVLLTPTYAVPPWELGWFSPLAPREEIIARTQQAVPYTPVQSAAGVPAMSVPLYWTADELPIGSLFAAAPGREDVLLALAYELESARPWAERWAPHSFVRVAAA
jgi:amidase